MPSKERATKGATHLGRRPSCCIGAAIIERTCAVRIDGIPSSRCEQTAIFGRLSGLPPRDLFVQLRLLGEQQRLVGDLLARLSRRMRLQRRRDERVDTLLLLVLRLDVVLLLQLLLLLLLLDLLLLVLLLLPLSVERVEDVALVARRGIKAVHRSRTARLGTARHSSTGAATRGI